MASRSMSTRLSAKNLRQLTAQADSQDSVNMNIATQNQSQLNLQSLNELALGTQSTDANPHALNNETEDDTRVRDYDLNYERALKKKAKACQVPYFVTSEIKGGNHIFYFSAAMYELYRQRLCDHYLMLDQDKNSNIKVAFQDSFDKTGSTVETLARVYQTVQSGKDRLRYSINLYHTKTKIMVNGRQATQFNHEHSQITDVILSSQQVSDMDTELYNSIEEGLKILNVGEGANNQQNAGTRRQNQANPISTCSSDPPHDLLEMDSGSSPQSRTIETEILAAAEGGEVVTLCPTCKKEVDEGICCDRCELWSHYECQQLSDHEQKLYTDSDMSYLCLSCKFDEDCEGLPGSLAVDIRNHLESEPDYGEGATQIMANMESGEETTRKEGFQPGPIEISPHNSPIPKNRQATPEQEVNNHATHQPILKNRSGMTPRDTTRMVQQDGQSNKVVTDSSPHTITDTSEIVQNISKQEPVEVEKKTSRQQKKASKPRIKDSEQEEQLKLAKSVIAGLERKLGEMENSNKLMKQELNLLRSNTENRGHTLSAQEQDTGRRAQHDSPSLLHSQSPSCNSMDFHLLRDQVRSMEIDILRNRVYNLEMNLQHQRAALPIQPGPHNSSVFGDNRYIPLIPQHPFPIQQQPGLPYPMIYHPHPNLHQPVQGQLGFPEPGMAPGHILYTYRHPSQHAPLYSGPPLHFSARGDGRQPYTSQQAQYHPVRQQPNSTLRRAGTSRDSVNLSGMPGQGRQEMQESGVQGRVKSPMPCSLGKSVSTDSQLQGRKVHEGGDSVAVSCESPQRTAKMSCSEPMIRTYPVDVIVVAKEKAAASPMGVHSCDDDDAVNERSQGHSSKGRETPTARDALQQDCLRRAVLSNQIENSITPEYTRETEPSFFSERQSLRGNMPEKKLLKIGTLNVKNIETNEAYVRELLKSYDLLAIQEHWLFTFQLSNFESIFPSHYTYSKAVDETDPLPPTQKPRGYGGVAILYRKNSSLTVKKQIHGENRIVVVEVLSSPPLCICNVYMPSRNSKGNSKTDDNYQGCLDQLEEILNIYSKTHAVFLLGDFNASLIQRKGNSQDRMLETFVSRNSLFQHQSGQCTFVHPNKSDRAEIDYIFHNKLGQQIVKSVTVETTVALNTSDHTPVVAVLDIEIGEKTVSDRRIRCKPKWEKCDKQAYADSVGRHLRSFATFGTCGSVELDILGPLSHLIATLRQATEDSIPNYKPEIAVRQLRQRPWTEKIHQVVRRCHLAWWEWKKAGSPQEPTDPYVQQRKAQINL